MMCGSPCERLGGSGRLDVAGGRWVRSIVPAPFARPSAIVSTPLEPFPYHGDPSRRAAVEAALRGVIDPEMALNIVDLGLVYGVDATAERIAIDLTMTSAACPVAELIIDDIRDALQRALGADTRVDVELCWDPPWTPEHMSASAREAMGW